MRFVINVLVVTSRLKCCFRFFLLTFDQITALLILLWQWTKTLKMTAKPF